MNKLFSGSGGGAPSNTADNLLSEDIVEFALAVSEGPIRGLSEGAKSFFVGATPLVSKNGQRNFDKFAIGVHPGYPEGSALPLKLKLGGVSSNTSVGVELLQNVPVSRQTESQLRNAIDQIEVRIMFSRLLRADDDGSLSENTANFKIEYRPSASNGDWYSFSGDVGDAGEDIVTTPFHNPGDSGNENLFIEWLVGVGDHVTSGQILGTGTIIDILAPSTGTLISLETLAADTPLTQLTGNLGVVQADIVTVSGQMSIRGKTSSGYVKEFRANVARLTDDDYSIRVTKLSPDDDPEDVVSMTWESFQSTTKGDMIFPDTAIVHGLGVANGQFSSIPELGGIYDGLMIRVPTNYNPDTRTYDEAVPWNGSFKFAWTNNPAWILYDLIVNTRYGLAKHRRYIDANRYSFYQAAKWCDQPVAIGATGQTRPRYTFNAVISDPRPAFEMLNYVAGSFNALVWDDLQGQVHLRVDKDDPAVMLFSPENVTDEGFGYTFTDITTRANDMSVTFINPEMDWTEDRRRIPNVTTSEENIEKYGRIPLDYIAVGCTNFHEAIAKTQVRLISALTETTMVSFVTTRQGALLSLYDVILIADPVMGWSQSGRLTSYDSNYLYFRDSIYIETMGTYVVKIQTVDGVVEVNVSPESTGHVNRFHLLEALPPHIPRYTVFTIEGSGSSFGYAKPFRVMSLEEVDGSPYLFRVYATEINRNKYTQVEGEPTDLDEFDFSNEVPGLPGQPTNFTAKSGDSELLVLPTGEVISRILCTWRRPFGSSVQKYVLQYKLKSDDEKSWQTINTNEISSYIAPVIPGSRYSLRLAAVDKDGVQSNWVIIKDHLVVGKTKVPQGVTFFSAFGGVFQIELKWSFGDAPDIKKVEIWSNTVLNRNTAIKLTDLSYPTNTWIHQGLGIHVTLYYWIRVQDTSGNFSLWSVAAQATTESEPGVILDILEGKITESELFADLGARIDLIDAEAIVEGSVAWRVLQESNARENAITDEQIARVDADGVLLGDINTVKGRVQSAEAAIVAVNTIEVTSSSAVASALATLKAAVNEPTTGLAAAQASLTQLNNVSSTSGSANASSLYNLTAYITNPINGLPGAYGQIAANKTIAADATEINTLALEQVTARLDDVGGITIEEKFESQVTETDGLKGQYTIKIDSGDRVVGFGLASTVPRPGFGDPYAQFLVRADSFGVAFPGQTSNYPFIVGLVNGMSTTGINGALVVDGSITVKYANIGVAEVGTLSVAGNAITVPVSLSAGGNIAGTGVNDWINVLTTYITLLQPGVIQLNGCHVQTYGSGIRSHGTRIKVNDVVVMEVGGESVMDTVALAGSLGVGIGTFTLTMDWWGQNSGISIGSRNLVGQGAMR